VTIGRGPAAMLRIDNPALADLHAVINVNDDGSVQILDLGGPTGTSVWVSSHRSAPTGVMFTSSKRRHPTWACVGCENCTQAMSAGGMFGLVVVGAL